MKKSNKQKFNLENKNKAQPMTENAPVFGFQPFPDNFDLITYPSYMKVDSIADKNMAAKM